MNAFNRIQVRPTEILQNHMQQAVMELNLLLVKLSNQGPNLWTVDLQSVPLVQGSATYSIPAETIQILDCWLRTGTTTASYNDRYLFPMSRTEYAAQAVKATQGPPTQFWFDRLVSPTITLYPTPDGNGPFTIYFYRTRQIQDGTITNGYNLEIQYRWFDAIVSGLAYRLARIFAPQLEQIRKADADESWVVAAKEDTENVPMYITPSLGGYFR